jgi:4-oxalocrotonate tautomerase
MPIVHVYAYERGIEKKRKLVKDITDAVCRDYDVAPEIVTVYIFDIDRKNAAHAGVLACDEPAG